MARGTSSYSTQSNRPLIPNNSTSSSPLTASYPQSPFRDSPSSASMLSRSSSDFGSRHSFGGDSRRESVVGGGLSPSEKVSPDPYSSARDSCALFCCLGRPAGGHGHRAEDRKKRKDAAAPLRSHRLPESLTPWLVPSFLDCIQFSLPNESMQDLENTGPEADDYLHNPSDKRDTRVRPSLTGSPFFSVPPVELARAARLTSSPRSVLLVRAGFHIHVAWSDEPGLPLLSRRRSDDALVSLETSSSPLLNPDAPRHAFPADRIAPLSLGLGLG